MPQASRPSTTPPTSAGAFVARNLSLLAYSNGFTSWHYRAHDLRATLALSFFTSAGDMLSAGDHVTISAPDGSAILLVADVAPTRVVEMVSAQRNIERRAAA